VSYCLFGANAFNNRGVAYADLKLFEKAIQDYDQAIKLNPKDADVFNNHGNAYVDLKKLKKPSRIQYKQRHDC
jgi:tetratricopeptide (TPR) repeat protein